MKDEVKYLASKKLVTVPYGMFLDDAYKLMQERGIRHFPVVDDYERVIGIISDRDFKRAMNVTRRKFDESLTTEVEEFDEQTTVRDFMSWPVITVSSTETVKEVANKMLAAKISALLIEEDGYINGIVTTQDMLKLLVELLEDGGLAQRVDKLAYQSHIGEYAKILSDMGI